MDRWKGRIALVTGASVGIGAAIVNRLCGYGMTVVGCARNLEKFENLVESVKGAEGRLIIERCDVSCKEDVKALFSFIKERFGRIDVCINNAAVLHREPLLSGDYAKFQEMLSVNVLGSVHVTQEAVKIMKACGAETGHIINISSIAGHRVVNSPGSHFYSATKYAVRALTEGIRNELRADNLKIRISSISPGLTDTPMAQSVLSKLEDGFEAIQPQDIADIVQLQLSIPDHVQIHDVVVRPTQDKS